MEAVLGRAAGSLRKWQQTELGIAELHRSRAAPVSDFSLPTSPVELKFHYSFLWHEMCLKVFIYEKVVWEGLTVEKKLGFLRNQFKNKLNFC